MAAGGTVRALKCVQLANEIIFTIIVAIEFAMILGNYKTVKYNKFSIDLTKDIIKLPTFRKKMCSPPHYNILSPTFI